MHIKVRVTTGAKKERLEKEEDHVFNVSVRQKAEQNKANKRVTELVAKHFEVEPAKVKIVLGHHRPSKILFVS